MDLALDKSRLYSSSSDGTVRIWNRRSGECIHVLETYSGLPHLIRISRSYVLSSLSPGAGRPRVFTVWNSETGEKLWHLEKQATYLELDDKRLVAGYTHVGSSSGRESGGFQIIDIPSGRTLKHFAFMGHVQVMRSVGTLCAAVVLKDSTTLGSSNPCLETWNLLLDEVERSNDNTGKPIYNGSGFEHAISLGAEDSTRSPDTNPTIKITKRKATVGSSGKAVKRLHVEKSF